MPLKKIAAVFLKYGLSVGLIAYLVWDLSSRDAFGKLQEHLTTSDPEHPKNWTIFALGWLAAFTGISINIFRWRMLARTLGLQLSLREGLRVGYVSNFVAQLGFGLGIVGGDAVRVVFLAKTNPTRKTEGAATVVVDRALGLLSLLVLAAISSFFLPLGEGKDFNTLREIFWSVRIAGLVAVIGCGVVLIPGFTHSSLWDQLSHVPKIGGILEKLVNAVRIYRTRLDALLLALGLSLLSQTCAVTSLYFVAKGLGLPHPSFGLHFVVGPIAMISGALPIGAFEVTLCLLYRATQPGLNGEEILVAIAYRVIVILIALVGLVVYLATRAESAALLEDIQKSEGEDV